MAPTTTLTSFRKNIWEKPSIRSGSPAKCASCTRSSRKKSAPWGEKIVSYLKRVPCLASLFLAAALCVSASPQHEENGQTFDAPGKNRHIIFYDQRGDGRSSPLKPGQSCNLADQIADLEALRAHLGFEKWDMLGHSWGGYLSMAYSARYPHHIAHLMIVDSAAPKWSDTLFLFSQIFPEITNRRAGYTFADEMGDQAASDASIHDYLTMLFYSAEKRDAFLRQVGPGAFHKDASQAVMSDLPR